MRRHVSVALAGLIAVLSLSSSCLMDHPDDPGLGADDGTASIVLALTMVPSDVQCLEVSVTGGGTTRTQLFSLTPGMATNVTVPGVPGGSVSVSERAFAVACTAVTATTPPTWLSVMPVMATVTPGQTAAVTVVLRRAGQIQITNDFQDGQFIASQGALAFGNVIVGSTPPPTSFTITNGGTTTATLPALTIVGTNAGQFVVQAPATGNPCTATTSLAPGAFCTTGVRFAPSSTGAKSATFTIGAIAAVSLSGTGLSATSVLMPSVTSLAFGTLALGSNVTMSFTITNTGTAAVTLPSLLPGGADATQFLVPAAATNPCTSGASLAAGAVCNGSVRFFPTTTGQKVASLLVGTTSVALTGTAVTSTLMPSVTLLMFPNTIVGNGSFSTMTFTITNTGTGAVTLPTLQASNGDATQFIVPPPSGTNPCMSGASLAAGAMCTATVRFFPTTTGLKAASLLVGSTSVALRGTGI